MTPAICIITSGHLATCPRMLKAADALSAAGYAVHVVSARHTRWATLADADVRRSREQAWQWSAVSYERTSAPIRTCGRARGIERPAPWPH